jgi:transposase-like protein
MVHKLRDVMGKRDSRYNLHGDVEIDEGFFSTETPEAQKDCPLKRGRGSQRKTSVLVMAESSFPDTPSNKKRSTPKIVGHIKMEVIDDLKASTETPRIKQATDGKANATTDGSSTYASLEKDGAVASHKAVVMDDKKKLGKVLPWVHIAISNAKRSILDTYHDIKAEFLQLYLNEFCYKFNRRYFGFRLFERLELCACTYRAEFKHRIY